MSGKINPVVHFEMPYEDRERLMKFYTQAFGWQMQKLDKFCKPSNRAVGPSSCPWTIMTRTSGVSTVYTRPK